jgi:O-antigen/teichoic acid export membrane protein
MFDLTNLNNLSVICFFVVFVLCLLILYKVKPAWIMIIKDNKEEVYIPLLILYSVLFASTSSVIVLLYFSKANFNQPKNKIEDKTFDFKTTRIYA